MSVKRPETPALGTLSSGAHRSVVFALGITGANPLSASAPAPRPVLSVTAFPAPDPETAGSRARAGGRRVLRAEEREVVARMQAGDREAFGAIYERYAQRVYAFALRRLRDREEAEDICQDVFVEVARSIGSFQGRSQLGTWILGIAFHEVCGRRRRFRRRPLPLEVDGETVAFAREAPPDRQVDAARVLARCVEVLGRDVGPAQREVFELHLGGAAGVAAIAASVGRSRQAVKISLFRTRRHLHARVPGLRELLAPA